MVTTAAQPESTVLVVDDEPGIRRVCVRCLQPRHRILEAATLAEASAMLGKGGVDVCLIDMMLPDGNAVERLTDLRASSPRTEFVLMTGAGGVEAAVAAVKAGAYDFVTKPFEPLERIVIAVAKALERKSLLDRADALESHLKKGRGFDAIVSSGETMARVLATARDVAATSVSVLVRGESGTGKELFARALHEASPRAKGAFVGVNCGALPAELIESELFGHVKGSFTGAQRDKPGLFEDAHGGTLFLDEIGEMPAAAQVRLLRVLQSGEVRRVGANETKTVDVRVVAATNSDLEAAMKDGRFREDLYYRVAVVELRIPPLRERADDIPVLASTLLRRHASAHGKPLDGFTDEALDRLVRWSWPGNVRELSNVVERAVVVSKGTRVEASVLPDAILKATQSNGKSFHVEAPGAGDAGEPAPYGESRDRAIGEFERGYVAALLRRTSGNMAQAARLAGLDRSNFRKLVLRAGLDFREFGAGGGTQQG